MTITPGLFQTILADPPWRFGNTRTRAAAGDHYPTLAYPEIAGLVVDGVPVSRLVGEQGHLYLWVTAAHLQEGLGNYWRHAHEICLFGVRGNVRGRNASTIDVFHAAREEHSRKPEAFYELIERFSPGPMIELFARRTRPWWVSWGNDPAVLAPLDTDVVEPNS